MSIRTKTIVLIAATTAVLLSILYTLFLLIVLGQFAQLERRDAERSALQALNALNDEQAQLDAFNNDWATWDDTYAFIASGDPRYLASNLVDETFLNASLNFMVFVDNDNRVVYAKGFDYHLAEEVPLPPPLLARMLGPKRNQDDSGGDRVRSGMLLPADPTLVSYRPILTSTREGPARGTLLMGRYLDREEIQGWARPPGSPCRSFGSMGRCPKIWHRFCRSCSKLPSRWLAPWMPRVSPPMRE